MSKKSQWGSKLGFILASAGSAIGLGAIWKFPYMTAANGGGDFLLVFLISTIVSKTQASLTRPCLFLFNKGAIFSNCHPPFKILFRPFLTKIFKVL